MNTTQTVETLQDVTTTNEMDAIKTTSEPPIADHVKVKGKGKGKGRKAQDNTTQGNSFVSVVCVWSVQGESTQSKLCTVEYSAFPQSLGRMLNDIPVKFSFRLLNHNFTVPSLTSRNSNPERAAAIFKQVVTNFFPASEERTVAISKDTKQGEILLSMQKAGFRFKTLCKAEVMEAVDIWLKNKKAKLSAHQAVVKVLNAEMIEETKHINAETKKVNIRFAEIITGLESKREKLLLK